MSDNKRIRGPQDAQRINVNEDYELEYWSGELGVSKDRLRQAVRAVGVMAKDVRSYLGRDVRSYLGR